MLKNIITDAMYNVLTSLRHQLDLNQERIALIDAKISKKQEEIKTLEAQKQKLLHPVTMRTVMEKAKAAGLSAEEIAEKLGLEM